MRSFSYDFSVIEHKDHTAVFNGTYPLGNGYNGGTGKFGFKCFPKCRIRFIVKSGGGVIKNYYIRLCGNGSCDKKALALASGKVGTFGSNNVVVFFRKSFDEFFRLGDFCRIPDIFIGKIATLGLLVCSTP